MPYPLFGYAISIFGYAISAENVFFLDLFQSIIYAYIRRILQSQSIWRVVRHRISGGRWTTRDARDPYAYVVAAFQALPSPDYVPGPEYPPSPDFVPKPVYLEFMPLEDESNPEEDDDEDPEEDPADGGDDGDDEEDDKVDIEEDEEEEEHPALADSTAVALPAVDQASSAEETEPFETDESAATPPPYHAYHITARISIRDEPPTPFWSDTEIHSLPLPPIISPLPVSPPLLVSSLPPASPIRSLGYRAAMIWLRVEAPSTSYSLPLPPPIIISHTRSDAPLSGTPPLLLIPLPTSSPPLHLLSTDHRADRLEDEMLVDMPRAPATDDTELGRRMTKFTTRVRQDTDEIYTRLDDEHSDRQLMAGQLNMLFRDRRTHARTARLMEAKARMSREA
ncbi:hypothetical protein Tco_0516401 [Tanacetum coccineum]